MQAIVSGELQKDEALIWKLLLGTKAPLGFSHLGFQFDYSTARCLEWSWMVLNDLECTVHKVQTGSGRQNLRPSGNRISRSGCPRCHPLPNLTTSPRLWPTFTPKAPGLRNCLLKLSMDSYGLSQHSCRMLISDGPPQTFFGSTLGWISLSTRYWIKLDQLISILFQLISMDFNLLSAYFQWIFNFISIDFNGFQFAFSLLSILFPFFSNDFNWFQFTFNWFQFTFNWFQFTFNLLSIVFNLLSIDADLLLIDFNWCQFSFSRFDLIKITLIFNWFQLTFIDIPIVIP